VIGHWVTGSDGFEHCSRPGLVEAIGRRNSLEKTKSSYLTEIFLLYGTGLVISNPMKKTLSPSNGLLSASLLLIWQSPALLAGNLRLQKVPRNKPLEVMIIRLPHRAKYRLLHE